MTATTIAEPGGSVPVVAKTDVLVVGGGPAGMSAAIAARREGCAVTMVERYPYLAGGHPERDAEGLVGPMGAAGILRDENQNGEGCFHRVS